MLRSRRFYVTTVSACFSLFVIGAAIIWHWHVANELYHWDGTICSELNIDRIGDVVQVSPISNKVHVRMNDRLSMQPLDGGLAMVLSVVPIVGPDRLEVEFARYSMDRFDFYPILVGYEVIPRQDEPTDTNTSDSDINDIESEDQAIELIKETIKQDRLFVDFILPSCLSFYSNRNDDGFDVHVYEEHGEACRGDPRTSPQIESFQVFPDRRIYVEESHIRAEPIPYKCYLEHRKQLVSTLSN